MTLLHHMLLAAAPAPAKSGSSLSTFLFLPLIIAAGYLLFIRPRKARMKQQATQAAKLDVGAEVMSVGGIIGTIVAVDEATFEVEVADGVTMTFVKRAINPRPPSAGGAPPPVSDAELPPDPFDEHPAAGDDAGHERPAGDRKDVSEPRPRGDGEPGSASGGLGTGDR